MSQDLTPKKFYGKYRGTVLSVLDPQMIGRIQVMVPDVLGPVPSSWAMPCFPVGGKQYGFFALPQVGAGVWVEFEQGDPDYPIWSGCWFGVSGEPPAAALLIPPLIPGMVMQTTGQNTIMVSDTPGPTGGVLIKTTTGALISVNDTVGITISNGKGASILLSGPSVIINAGALVVT
ncbi:MAG: phage baseplate assembly protein V [Bryobacteraceae bacterium]|jgi:uncharacterized protein involved in type VI secretion and phage assembly